MDKVYMVIDLKSFFASVECVERGLDPFKTNLVVADPSRGRGAICLAVTPYMKSQGVRNRCRIYEIPKDMEYITALPRMKKYIEYSANIYGIFLKYIAPEDIHVYSIDEAFMDVTPYLKMYNKTPKEIGRMIIDDIIKTTGICATCGIGTNMFLAKIALDITAKHAPDFMGYLDVEKFKRELWDYEPITDIWNIGPGIARRLAKYGVFTLSGVAMMDPMKLYKEFGVNAEFLIDHANGIEPCTIKEIHNYVPKANSVSNSQVLFEDYNYVDALLVVKEMVELNVLNLVDKGLVTNLISLSIVYSKDVIPPTGGSMKIDQFTNSYKILNEYVLDIYRRTTDTEAPIRRIGIGFGNVRDEAYEQYTLFDDPVEMQKEKSLQHAINSVRKKYGKNALIKGMNLEEKATTRKRNTLIGGHNSE